MACTLVATNAGISCCWSKLCWWSELCCCDYHTCMCVQVQGALEKVLKMKSRASLQQSPLRQGKNRSPSSKHVQCCEAPQKSPPAMCAVPCRGAVVRITLLAAGFVIGKHSSTFTSQEWLLRVQLLDLAFLVLREFDKCRLFGC